MVRPSRPPFIHDHGRGSGASNVWSIVYCKGPEGEQLEFVQVLNPVKQTFGTAQSSRRQPTTT